MLFFSPFWSINFCDVNISYRISSPQELLHLLGAAGPAQGAACWHDLPGPVCTLSPLPGDVGRGWVGSRLLR